MGLARERTTRKGELKEERDRKPVEQIERDELFVDLVDQAASNTLGCSLPFGIYSGIPFGDPTIGIIGLCDVLAWIRDNSPYKAIGIFLFDEDTLAVGSKLVRQSDDVVIREFPPEQVRGRIAGAKTPQDTVIGFGYRLALNHVAWLIENGHTTNHIGLAPGAVL